MARVIRHWKQRFDPAADFVFLRRLRLGLDPKKPYVQPGDPVPKHDARMGRGRLKKWWEARIIGLADWPDPDELKRKRVAEQTAAVEKSIERFAELSAKVENLKASDELAELDTLGAELEEIRGTIRKAVEVGVPVEIPEPLKPRILDTFDNPPEEPEDAAQGDDPEGIPSEVVEELSEAGVTIEARPDGGFEVLKPDGELGSFETLGEALAFARGVDLGGGADDGEEGPGVTVTDHGGGWYFVEVPGEEEVRKVQGKEALRELLVELGVEIDAH